MARCVRIGIAGYMGAGKSTCARLFEGRDAQVIDADAEAKSLMRRDRRLAGALREAFGESVIDDDGLPRFDELGRLAFGSVESLRTLNGVVHPPLAGHLERLVRGCESPVCLLDAALIPLWEGMEAWFDTCVWVDAPFETRLARLAARQGGGETEGLVCRMRLQEAILGVPTAPPWVVLPDSDCREYIADAIERGY
jgi:dephospho-CoA kinase